MLRTQGLEVEAPLAFAALHRLLLPVMRLREELPAPQARALRVAFGEEDGPSIEPFLVAVATLSMLTAAAEESTVLCVVEDAHWLDSATADALLFCARRLGADRVLLVFSARDGAATPFRPDGIDELQLAGLDPAAARELLDQRLGAAPAPEVTERLIAESAAATRWPCWSSRPSSAPDQLGGSSPLPAQLHLTTRVEQAFLDRSRLLPAPVQSAAAARGRRRHRRARRRPPRGVDPRRGRAGSRGRRGLRAPHRRGRRRCRCATRSCARPSTRPPPGSNDARRTGRWPTPLAGLGDSDREAWHRAAAAEGPDPDVVAALERRRVPCRATRRLRRGDGRLRTRGSAERRARRSVPR